MKEEDGMKDLGSIKGAGLPAQAEASPRGGQP